MLTTVYSFLFLLALAFFAIASPLMKYLQDRKGFRKYPNQNFLSGITDMVYGWEVGRKHPVFHTRRLHELLTKNTVVRLGPNWLSFGSSRAAKDIYGYNSPCLKAAIYDSLQAGGQHLVNISSRELHSSHRRMVATAYAPKNIEMWEPRITESTAVLIRKMDVLCTVPSSQLRAPVRKEDLTFDGNLWGMVFAFEGVIKIGLSIDPAFVEQGSDLIEIDRPDGSKEMIHLIDCMHSASRAASTLIWDTLKFPLLKKISMKASQWYASQWRNATDWSIAVRKLANERIERHDNGEHLDDLFQPMIEDKKTGGEPDITAQDRYAETEQMSISLVNTLYYLIKNPATIEQLRAELDAVLSADDHVAPWVKVKDVSYLRACIDESMRLSPPVATDLVRKTPPDKHYQIDTETVPGNTVVSISAFTAHRDPEIFPDPEAFKPERWLIKGDERLKNMLAAYIPFSAGSRGCIGRNVTILMQMVYLVTLVHRYEFALPSLDWEMQWTDYFNLWPNELPLKVWKRKI